MRLLDEIAGVNIYLDYETNIFDEVFILRDRFLERWDAGAFSRVEVIFEEENAKYLVSDVNVDAISAKELRKMRYFGIYALPSIIKAIKQWDNPRLYAAYLIITGQREAYGEYIKHPNLDKRTKAQKLEAIKLWYENNRSKIERVVDLDGKLRKETLEW